jgi:hypothetical protein
MSDCDVEYLDLTPRYLEVSAAMLVRFVAVYILPCGNEVRRIHAISQRWI